MKKFKVTILVPQDRIIEARDIQDAHNYVSKMMQNQPDQEKNPGPKVFSIEEVNDPEPIDFGDLG